MESRVGSSTLNLLPNHLLFESRGPPAGGFGTPPSGFAGGSGSDPTDLRACAAVMMKDL